MAKMDAKPAASADVDDEVAMPWADDALGQFLAAAWRNTVHALRDERERYATLAEIDALFGALLEDAEVSGDRMGSAFLVRTHGTFLTAASLALSGQVAQAYTLLRSALETAVQGLYVSSDPDRQQLWLGRNDSAEAEQRAQAMLEQGAPLDYLRELDPATAQVYTKLYARAGDRSGHPNTYANQSRTAGGPETSGRRDYFVCGNDVQRSCLRSVAQGGICVLTIFYYVFAERYRELELGERINKLRQGH